MRSLLGISIIGLSFISCALGLNLTESEFRMVLEGRCEEFQRIFLPDLVPTKKNCTRAADTFFEIFDTAGAACNESSYEFFIQQMQHPVPKNKGLLWSGFSREFLERIAVRGTRFNPVSYTLTGYLLDQITICEDVFRGTPGCPNSCKDATRTFWKRASLHYARSLSGLATIVLSARNDGKGNDYIFYNGSILAVVELPNLSPKVHSVDVWPVQSIATPKDLVLRNKCTHPTIKLLKEKIDKSGRKYKCVENSKPPAFAMCLDKPELCKRPVINGIKRPLGGQFYLMLSLVVIYMLFMF